MLTPDEASSVASDLWKLHHAEMSDHDKVRGYLKGTMGRPTLPEGANDELKELARMAVKNVTTLVVDSFVQSLAVTGFRSPSSQADAGAWAIWQRERMDARQDSVIRPSVAHGASYLRLRKDDAGAVHFIPRSPRQALAVYEDPDTDEWPEYVLDTRVVKVNGAYGRVGTLSDGEADYPVEIRGRSQGASVSAGEGEPHGFDVCPVVRFVNDRDAEDAVVGEVLPLVGDQRAINAVNMDRLIVSRFGAFPQKYVFGWAAEDSDELARMSAMRTWAIDVPGQDVKVGAFPAADPEAYNKILDEMVAHVAVKARVQVHALTGNLSNVGAETVALIDAPNQRKVLSKQRSFGESWEQALRKAAEFEGLEVPEDAEVKWRETESRSFAQVVDGISKLVASGVPIEAMVDQIPGLTQQQADAIVDAVRRKQATGLAAQVIEAARQSTEA